MESMAITEAFGGQFIICISLAPLVSGKCSPACLLLVVCLMSSSLNSPKSSMSRL